MASREEREENAEIKKLFYCRHYESDDDVSGAWNGVENAEINYN